VNEKEAVLELEQLDENVLVPLAKVRAPFCHNFPPDLALHSEDDADDSIPNSEFEVQNLKFLW
jgi:hypothetical protein